MSRTIAIGDIHGCNNTFMALLEKLDLSTDDELYLLGDLIDRGSGSREVVNTIFALKENEYKVYCLRGNHEQMMLDSEHGFYMFSQWVDNGGDKTLESFGVDFLNEMHQQYQDFFYGLPFYYDTNKYIFAHAGLNFDKDNILEDTDEMMWVRGFDRQQPKLGDKVLVHGHTPLSLAEILYQKGNCINVDGGCVFPQVEDKGYLVAIILETLEYVYVKNCEKKVNDDNAITED